MQEEYVSQTQHAFSSFSSPLVKDIAVFETVESTNKTAKQLAHEGALDGTLVLSREQTQGRGRFDRQWQSPIGGVYLSLILRPNTTNISPTLLPIVTALGVSTSITTYIDLPVHIKWPNDVHIQGKKIAGILVESSTDSKGVPYVILGIGLNLNTEPDQLSCDKPCTSIAREIGIQLDYYQALKRLLNHLWKYYQLYLEGDTETICHHWKQQTDTLGRIVILSTPQGDISGSATDISKEGFLIITTSSGEKRVITSGDLHYRFPA